MIKYWWIVLVGAVFAMSGCQWSDTTDMHATYPTQSINAYQGQSASSLFNDNGAPDTVQNLADGSVIWTYYTNYQPVGGGELISYDMPTNTQGQITCTVQVTIINNTVTEVISTNC